MTANEDFYQMEKKVKINVNAELCSHEEMEIRRSLILYADLTNDLHRQ